MIGLYAKAAAGAVLPRPSSLPDTVRTRTVRPTVGRVADYAAVCGFPLSDVLPATFPHVLAFGLQMELMAARSFPLALPGLVHVANAITLHRAIGLGEELDVRVHAERFAAHARGAQVDLVSAVSAGDTVVWEGRSTYLARGAHAPTGVAGELPEVATPEGPAAASWALGADLGRRYAAVSGDVNPIHLNPLTAKAFGFPRTIAHGMWTAAHALAALQGRLPEALTYTVLFRKPLLLPSRPELVTERVDGGWDLAVRSRAGVHLAGSVR
ncbi:MaoC/PaaZ C-terminal domain-containing protein [Pseudonocardia oroxyli]|uniref:Acyl dehydratase n=1 Tax=Pseudonocardia oroxyli TaxID=366584 RepID=A0A1G7PLV7_PSEOR|nr:MaoC/PaaZ C-terminal domain-containing protein [Pseudonocardia oroxyli]SDF86639.1 Acyl dehydratase [Pseudonocardia oroxyli]